MTVLAALWYFNGKPAARACEEMLRAQAPGDWTRRTSASDAPALGSASRAGAGGPVESASGPFSLVADVRLDNREDFLPQLGLTAAAAADLTDTRLMLRCFERWGPEIIDRLVGDFALVLWDKKSERLVLARDFAGQRPLHFHQAQGMVAVASMASGLHGPGLVPCAVDEAHVLEMLIGVPHAGRTTFFKGLERVEPGEVVTFARGAGAGRKFWTAPAGEIRLRSHEDYAEALLEKVDLAVKARIRGAGPAIGTHLSAGLDSSAVATSAAIQFPGRVLAFTSVPPDRLPPLPEDRFGDESLLAAQTAHMYPNIDHRLIETGDRLPLEDLERELRWFERPDLNLLNLAWSNRINDAAEAEGLKVMLIGNMGNTTISYGGLELLGQFLANGEIGRFVSEGLAAVRAGVRPRSLVAQAARQLLPRGLARRLDRLRSAERPEVAAIANPAAPGFDQLIAWHALRFDPSTSASRSTRAGMLTQVDPGTFNKGTLLRWGLELRDPTADRRVAEFCLQVPLSQYFRHGRSRALIRTALADRLPEAVLSTRLRGLQAAHWFSMFRQSAQEARRLLAEISDNEACRRLLDVDKMHRLIDQWPEAAQNYGPAVYRYGLLRGMSAGTFVRLHSARGD